MNKDECVNKLKGFLSRETFVVSSFLGRNAENFRKSLAMILQNIEEMENDKEPSKLENEFIINTIRDLKNIVLDSPVYPEFSDFADNWCFLVFNWNNNVLKNEDLNKDCLFIQRILRQHYTIVEAIDNLKFLNKKIRSFKDWNPPAFEVAKHYINYLEE